MFWKKKKKLVRDESPESAVSNVDASTNVFRIQVPEGIQPGQEFQIYAGNRIVRVGCPPGSVPGQFLEITIPADPVRLPPPPPRPPPPPIEPDSSNVTLIEDSDPPAYLVTIPEDTSAGDEFIVTIRGQQLRVSCPPNTQPGNRLRIVPPPPPPLPPPADKDASDDLSNPSMPNPTEEEETQTFQVLVPAGVQPGQPFSLLAAGVRVLVTCPINAGPGKRIRFKLPKALTAKRKPHSEAVEIKLSYDKDGWARTIRVSDMKFQWVRMDDKGDIDSTTRFDAEKSAYVRKLTTVPAGSHDDRTSSSKRDCVVMSLVPATQATVDSKVKGNKGEVVATYSEIADTQVKGFEEKAIWFQEKCKLLKLDWSTGRMHINLRRNFLLEDSVQAVMSQMSLKGKDFRKVWRFEFIGEAGMDAGGLAREWFQLVTSEIFNPDRGLWQSSEANQMCMHINPASKFIADDYLVYYRFLGRVMGKALLDGQLVNGHCVQYVYKHMLGWPITFKDLESIDEQYYTNLKQLKKMVDEGEDLEMLCLNFSTTQEIMGIKEEIELIPGGKEIDVSNDNFPEYLEACLRYRMMDCVKDQLTELLLGFFDVIPEPLLTVFDFQELELLMCGLPNIDMEDWKEHTEYSGDYEASFGDCPPCHWFWEVVEEFDQEMKARLLQFVTGTSGVPARGFGVLQGSDGNIRKFTIHGVAVGTCLYPRAHTCFNRIDLPLYETKEDLRERLKLSVTMAATGFDIE